MTAGSPGNLGRKGHNEVEFPAGRCGDHCGAVATAPFQAAFACSRALYAGVNNQIITTRSNDWLGSQKSNLWIYPRGMKRVGGKAAGAIAWTSKHGSDTVAGWDIATIDAFDEKRLSADGKFLSGEVSGYFKPAQPFKFGH
jgi:penicillin V acylase-like amidase (Ntn superfamily)